MTTRRSAFPVVLYWIIYALTILLFAGALFTNSKPTLWTADSMLVVLLAYWITAAASERRKRRAARA